MQLPLVWFTTFFCLGILFAGLVKMPFLFTYILAIVLLISNMIFIKKRFIYEILLFSLAFLLGAILLKNHFVLPNRHISKIVSYKNNQPYLLKGVIVSPPITRLGRASFIFEAREIQIENLKYHCCGKILVYLRGNRNLSYAEGLFLSGNLSWPFKNKGKNQKNYRDYLYHQGIFYIMYAKAIIPGSGLNNNKGLLLVRFAFWWKSKIEEIIFQYLSPTAASILDAMVLGEKRNIPPALYNSMVKTGTVHILVVSGFNVGLVAFIISLFLKILRIPRKTRFSMLIPLLILYCLMTGSSTPVVRATLMALVFMSAYFLKRQPNIYNSCAVAALFILGLNPRQLFAVGFQLSFASVLSIAYLYPKIKAALRLEVLKIRYLNFLVDGLLVSLSAWLGTAGFIAHYFKIFSPVTVIANLLIVPLATLITFCGFSFILIALVIPAFIPLFAGPCEFLSLLLIQINALLLKIPHAYFNLS